MAGSTSYLLFVQCALGLEKLLQHELEGFGVSARLLEGGAECRGGEETLTRVCVQSRLAESVRVRLKEFRATEFSTLEKGLRGLPFRAFFSPGVGVRVRVVCRSSKLWHSGAVKERVEAVLRERAGLLIQSEDSAQLIHVRLDDDQVQVSVDATGERLHRRGYREHVVSASLRETLAAALVISVAAQLAAREGKVTLWDPFCGAGTVALEALSWAHGMLPGVDRQFSFLSWRNIDARAFERFKEEATLSARAAAPLHGLRAILSDKSAAALEAAQHNAHLAQLAGSCQFEVGDVNDVALLIPEGAFVLANPPYGKRIEEAGAVKKLLRVLRQRSDLKPVVLLVGGAARDVIPKDRPALFRTKNGGVPVSARLLAGDLPSLTIRDESGAKKSASKAKKKKLPRARRVRLPSGAKE